MDFGVGLVVVVVVVCVCGWVGGSDGICCFSGKRVLGSSILYCMPKMEQTGSIAHSGDEQNLHIRLN